ncbi:MAG: hypothetical protein V1493_00255 [Candidatus Diapherotrites archaeon]
MAKPRAQRTAAQRQPAGRAIPGSVFTAQRLTADAGSGARRFLDTLDKRHSGKGARQIEHFVFRVPEATKQRYGYTGKQSQELWLVPARLPSTQTIGPHNRALYAKTTVRRNGRNEARYVFLKGSHTYNEMEPEVTRRLGQRTDVLRLPLFWDGSREFNTARLRGGESITVAVEAMKSAQKFRKAFDSLLEQNDPVVKSAWTHGIREAPTLEPIGVFEHLQVPAEYTTSPSGGKKRGDFVQFDPVRGIVPDSNLAGQLRPMERKAFRHEQGRAVSKARETGKPKTGVIKIADYRGRIAGKEDRASRMAVAEHGTFMYSVSTPFRVTELDHDAVSFYGPNLSVNREVAGAGQKMEAWGKLFEANGLRLVPEKQRGGTVTEYSVAKRIGRGWAHIPLQQARIELACNFARKIATGIYAMHKGANGTFTITEGRQISSLNPDNVSINGEILDLDTIRFSGMKRKKHAEEKRNDITAGQMLVSDFITTFSTGTLADAEARKAAYAIYDSIARQGKPA